MMKVVNGLVCKKIIFKRTIAIGLNFHSFNFGLLVFMYYFFNKAFIHLLLVKCIKCCITLQ